MERKFPLVLALAVAGMVVPVGGLSASADLLGDTTKSLNDTVNNTTGGVKDTVDNTTGGVKDTVNNTTDQATDTLDNATGGGGTTTPVPAPAPAPGGGGSGGGGGGGGGANGGVGPGGPGGSGGHGSQQGQQGQGQGGKGGGPNSIPQRPTRKPNGVPTKANPSLSIADFGPAPIGVPSFMIDQFSIPPFLLPIYQACGSQYGIPWEVLAGINRIETAFGTNLNVSTAGAVGWMQFIPSTWKAYGVDANGDHRKDPYNPVDAICAAARYLKAAGGDTDLRRGIFAYNHADWYVDEVLLYARQYGKLPEDLVGSITGLTQGDRFPIAARARYADDISERLAAKRAKPGRGAAGNVADVVSSSPTRRGINIYSREGAPVVAVNDGTITKIGHDPKLGRYLVLRDNYGNRFTYAQLGHVAKAYPVPERKRRLTGKDFKLVTPKKKDQAPTQPATKGKPLAAGGHTKHHKAQPQPKPRADEGPRRIFALPNRPHNRRRAELIGQLDDELGSMLNRQLRSLMSYNDGTVKNPILRYKPDSMDLRRLHEGSHVLAGTQLGEVGKTDELAPHLNFSIRPAGRGAPKIDPKPILDGWKLLEATAIYRAAGKNPLLGAGAGNVTQDLLLPKASLERRVLADPRLSLYQCGRNDIRTGQIDQRILAAMEYLADNGFRLTITSLKCGHSITTTSGSISEHSTGDAMDIAMVNGIPIVGHQGRGSITEAVIQTLLRLQGTMEPHQVISLMNLGGPSFAMADHYDHIHVGYYPGGTAPPGSKQFERLLKPKQWRELVGRIAKIRNPHVPTSPSRFAIPTRKHGGKPSGD